MSDTGVTTDERWVTLGRLGKTHGIRGWVWIRSDCDPADAIFAYQPIRALLNGRALDVRWAQWQVHSKGLIAKIEGIDTPEQAQAWSSAELTVPRQALPETTDDSWYWTDLEGLDVVSTTGVPLGKIDHLFEAGGNTVMVVRGGARECLIPFVMDQVVQEVRLDEQRITVDWDPEF